MKSFSIEEGRIGITLTIVPMGDDLCIAIYGGNKPHIGCVTLSVPRPSLQDADAASATTSVLNLIGHKDDEAARYVSHLLSSQFNKNVAVICGIHVDDITIEEIQVIKEILKDLSYRVIEYLK